VMCYVTNYYKLHTGICITSVMVEVETTVLELGLLVEVVLQVGVVEVVLLRVEDRDQLIE